MAWRHPPSPGVGARPWLLYSVVPRLSSSCVRVPSRPQQTSSTSGRCAVWGCPPSPGAGAGSKLLLLDGVLITVRLCSRLFKSPAGVKKQACGGWRGDTHPNPVLGPAIGCCYWMVSCRRSSPFAPPQGPSGLQARMDGGRRGGTHPNPMVERGPRLFVSHGTLTVARPHSRPPKAPREGGSCASCPGTTFSRSLG